MRILWFVNTPPPEMAEYENLKGDLMGCWTGALKEALMNSPDFQSEQGHQLGIACSLHGFSKYRRFMIGKVHYFSLPKSRACEYLQSYERELYYCLKAVEVFDPDIVHVHGTEEFYGLIQGKTAKPVIISVQGILSAVVKVYFGSMTWREILLSPQVIKHYLMMRRKIKTENRIFSLNRFFIGRTLWDKAHLMRLCNHTCKRYHCSEVMRREFYQNEWDINKAIPDTIACVSSPYAYKGIDCLIEAMGYLKKRLPGVVLNIYGSFYPRGYAGQLIKKVRRLGLSRHIRFCGFKGSGQLANELKKARAFVIASHMENSSNTLQEAMLIGTPSVVSFAGGLPTIAKDEQTSLMFPRADAASMSECLHRILKDEGLSLSLSRASRQRARETNDPGKNVRTLLGIYKDVIRE